MNKIPNDQQVADESGSFEDIDFVIEPFSQLRIARRSVAISFVQPFVTKFAQVSFACLSVRHRILRVFRTSEFELEVAALRDFKRVCDCLGQFTEEIPHLAG